MRPRTAGQASSEEASRVTMKATCRSAVATRRSLSLQEVPALLVDMDSDSMRSEGGVQRGSPLWQGVWGLCPQFPKGGRVGIKDICLIETMLVETTPASLNSYIARPSLEGHELLYYSHPMADTDHTRRRFISPANPAGESLQGPVLPAEGCHIPVTSVSHSVTSVARSRHPL